MDDLPAALDKVHKRIERLDSRVFDNYGPRLDKVEREMRGTLARSRVWEQSSKIVLEGDQSLQRQTALHTTQIRAIAHDVAELVTALRASQVQAESRTWLLAILVGLATINLGGLFALLLVVL